MSIEKALGKLRAAQMCHPNAVQALIDEAIAAIQQAEAQQPATGEPVGFVDFQGTVFWHDGPPTADSLLFAAKPVSHDKAKWCEYVAGMVFTWLEMQENLKEEDRCIKAIAGIIERRMWALLTTHPAPSVLAVVDAAVRLACAPAWAGISDEDIELEQALRNAGFGNAMIAAK